VTLAVVMPYLLAFCLVLIRCSGLFMMVPTLGGELVPVRMRGAVAATVAVVLTPMVEPVTCPGLLMLFLAAAGELLMGVAMGLVVRLVLLSAELAGEVAGMQMGFAFNRVADPLTREPAAVTSRMLGIIALLLFLAIDGHHILLAGLSGSLREAPVGTVLPRASYAANLFPLLSLAMTSGLRIAAPVMIALLLTNCAIGLLARAAPQLNLFIFAFGITIAIGMLMLTTSVGPSLNMVLGHIRRLPDYLTAVVAGG
jgi:flagellar biosynthetic protein FliR